jgi:5-methyltetrahydrofolate--homocysteine methyltransferase
MMGHDAHCAYWIKRFREPAPEGEAAGGARGRREGRRRGGGGAAGGGAGGETVSA